MSSATQRAVRAALDSGGILGGLAMAALLMSVSFASWLAGVWLAVTILRGLGWL